MVGPTELKVLRIVGELGETGAYKVSRRINIDPNYARLILEGLNKSGHLDYLVRDRRKMYAVTPKGNMKLDTRRIVEGKKEKSKTELSSPTIVWKS